MFPVLYQGDGWAIATWHVFYVLGALLAWVFLHLQRIYTVPEMSKSRLDVYFIYTYIASYFGARILSILVEGEYRKPDFHGIGALFQFGSMTLYGGILAGAATLFLLARREKLPIFRIADLFAAPLLLGIFAGRIGCFLNGDDYGRAVNDQFAPPWWAVKFPNLDDGIFRYPVQIWESICCGILAIVILKLARTEHRRGSLASVAIYGYAGSRFLLEFVRGDERGYFFATQLSTSQGISLVVAFLWSLYLLATPR